MVAIFKWALGAFVVVMVAVTLLTHSRDWTVCDEGSGDEGICVPRDERLMHDPFKMDWYSRQGL